MMSCNSKSYCNNSTSSLSSLNSIFWCPDHELDKAIRNYNLYDNDNDNNNDNNNGNGSDNVNDNDNDNDSGNNGPPLLTIATRDGPKGSRILQKRTSGSSSSSRRSLHSFQKFNVPAATLQTTTNGEQQQPVNPTGAGNAYSAAMTALLGNNVPLRTAACISTGVGAIVCEYEGLPTTTTAAAAATNNTSDSDNDNDNDWSSILDRIYEAAMEVESKLD